MLKHAVQICGRRFCSSVLESTGFSEKRQLDEAFQAADALRRRGSRVPIQVLRSLLHRCMKAKELEIGRRIYALIADRGFDTRCTWGNNLIRMFDLCGSLEEATQVFRRILEPIASTWRIIILANIRHGHGKTAVSLYKEMQQSGLKPDKNVYIAVLKACASTGALAEGRIVHSQIDAAGFSSDLFVGNTLVDMYAKCGNLEEAGQVFERLPKRDVVSWNALIAGLGQHGRGQRALMMYERMQQQGLEPDEFTFSSVLKACASLGALNDGRRIHLQVMRSGRDSNAVVANTLVFMYAKCGGLVEAREVFDKLVKRDAFSWNAMIAGYAKAGFLVEAHKLFDLMPGKNVVTWSALIAGFAEHGQGMEALQLFDRMQLQGIKPNKVTFLSVLKACSRIAALSQGRQVHLSLLDSGLRLDAALGNTLISMYAKCGSLAEARKVFDELRTTDVVSWTAMIAAYAQHGHGQDALQVFHQMQEIGVKPDDVTFLCVLSACGHAGLLEEGCRLFRSMSEDFGIIPGKEHYSCMVDLLCRGGHLDRAENFIRKMPVQPDIAAWTSLLGACLAHGNWDLGKVAFDSIVEIEPSNTAAHVLMSNIYAATGRWEDRAEIRNRMQYAGVKKTPGRTWIELGDQVHSFQVEDTDHPERIQILAELHRLLDANAHLQNDNIHSKNPASY